MAPAAPAAGSSDPGLPLARNRWPGLGPHGLPGCYPRRPPRPSEMSEARTRSRSISPLRPLEPAGGSGGVGRPGPASAPFPGAAPPVGRRAGLRRGAEAGAPAGAGAGARGGAARLPGLRAVAAVGGVGGGRTKGEAWSAAPARSARRRCGRAGRGENLVPPSGAWPGTPPFLPAALGGTY
ncbi:unnamed protein product [Nyctereutes procyonoides]|uniref:(raccoon dog) hypothetical protein n=1 Tax=Nyctereutes procyonoides TaxID=34880 RepID=A0A811Y741_NYCPR|nr:unnamed protein product [Nyctereutes procyonoides]